MDRSDIVDTVDSLVARRCASRLRDPSDRRRNIITLTASGRRHYRRLDEIILEVQDRVLQSLDQSERDTFVDLLRRIVEP
jgi:DNA-binding MarR family transcriptional regulator